MKKVINSILFAISCFILIISAAVIGMHIVSYIYKDSSDSTVGVIVDCTIVNSETKKEYFYEHDISDSEFVNSKYYQKISLMNACQNSMLLCVEESGSIKKCSDSYIEKIEKINNGIWKES